VAHYKERLLWSLKLAELEAQLAKEHALRDLGITPPQQQALTVIHDHAGITAAELARRCLVTPQTMASTVARLESNGLVRRQQHAMHGTLIELRLTAEGETAYARADERIDALESALVTNLSKEERRVLTDLLGRVTASAESARSA
jgi:DNA-binding MarR family transcriptional regulator